MSMSVSVSVREDVQSLLIFCACYPFVIPIAAVALGLRNRPKRRENGVCSVPKQKQDGSDTILSWPTRGQHRTESGV